MLARGFSILQDGALHPISWFINPIKYSYICHKPIVMGVMFTNLANELGHHLVGSTLPSNVISSVAGKSSVPLVFPDDISIHTRWCPPKRYVYWFINPMNTSSIYHQQKP